MAEEFSTPPGELPRAAELRELIARAQAGDATALPQLRTLLDEHPELWQRVGDLAAWVERAWLALLANDHPLAVAALQRTAAQLKADLAGEQPTAVERLLVDQVVATWLETKCWACQAAQPGASPAQATLRLKQLDSAHKRHANALKLLTQLRALAPLHPATPLRLFQADRQVG